MRNICKPRECERARGGERERESESVIERLNQNAVEIKRLKIEFWEYVGLCSAKLKTFVTEMKTISLCLFLPLFLSLSPRRVGKKSQKLDSLAKPKLGSEFKLRNLSFECVSLSSSIPFCRVPFVVFVL